MFREQSYFSNIGAQSMQQMQYRQLQYSQPPVMSQPYYNSYMNNQALNYQFAPHNQPIYIAGPIYKNTPAFIGPNYLSHSLFEPIKKPSFDPSKYPKQELQLEQNVRFRDDVIDQWNEKQKKASTVVPRESTHSSKTPLEVPRRKSSRKSHKKSIEDPEVKRKKAQRNLRIHWKAYAFMVWYFIHLKKLLQQKRKRQYDNSNDIINTAFEHGAEWALTFLEPVLMEFWKKTERYDWLESQLAEKEQLVRVGKIKFYLDKIIDKLVEYTRETNIEPELLLFMAQITQNYEFPAQGYYFNFEITKLHLTSFAALKNMKPPQQKMIIALFIMIRILGFTILYAPWTIGLDNINKNPIMKGNGLIITSVLQELVISEFRSLKDNSSNQNHLALENKLMPRQLGPLKVDPDPKDLNERKMMKALVEPLIYPTYTGDEMKLLFEGQKDWVERTKDKLDELYSRMLKIVTVQHNKTRVKLSVQAKKLWK